MTATGANNAPVFLAASPAQRLTVLAHDQERGHARQSNEGSGDEAILVAHISDPRRDSANELTMCFHVKHDQLTRSSQQTS